MRRRVWQLAMASSMAVALACDKKGGAENPAAAASTTALAPSVAEGTTSKYTVDPLGKSSIDMPAPKEHIKAGTSAAAGTLDVDLANLANSRGEVRVDLTTLTTHTFGNDSDATQTEHALTWLEVSEKQTADAS